MSLTDRLGELKDEIEAQAETIDSYRDECTRVMAERDQAQAELRSATARIDALVRELEASAAVTAPSRKSEIETRVAQKLRAITTTT